MAANTSPTDDRITLHLVGHAHIDPVWLWRWHEGFSETHATFRSALDRMKEFPEFIFTASAAAHYEWIEKNDPAMFRQIKQRVKEGRWVPAGGWWVESDLNLVNGESLIRQALAGKRYFQEKLGFDCRVGFSPDSFGHSAHLPKILAGCGFEGYLYMRPNDTENPRVPMPVYRWYAPDGSLVIAFRLVWSYNAHSVQGLETKHSRIPQIVAGTPFARDMFCFYGVGNHGGGPTIELLKAITAWRKDPSRHRLVFNSMEGFLKVARPKLAVMPEWRDEMQPHALGCLTAEARVKATNRRTEEALLSAEIWSSVAEMVTKRVPRRQPMDRAWKDLLFNQFHDILPGSSVRQAYADARDQVGGAAHVAATQAVESIASIAWNVDTRGEDAPLLIFNPHPFVFEGVIETEDIGFGLAAGETLALVDAKGRPTSHQLVAPHTLCQRVRVAAKVSLPAMGYTFLRQRKVAAGSDKARSSSTRSTIVTTQNQSLKNDALEVSLNREGYLSLRDLRSDTEVFTNSGGCVPLLIEDHSDTWSHRITRFDKVAGRFEMVDSAVLEAGPVRGRLRVNYRYGNSALRLDYTLGASEPFVGIEAWIDWREQWKMLKLALPTGLDAIDTTAEVPYGTVRRLADGVEWPMSQWVDIASPKGTRGLAVANDSKHGYSAQAGELRLSLLRSPPHAYDENTPIDFSNPHLEWMDQGVHEFRLALIPHTGDWRDAGVIEIARQLNRPPICLAETFHGGRLPARAGFIECRGAGVYVGAFKPAEKGKGWIVRANEWFGRRTRASFTLPALGRTWRATFGPHQLKTFFVPVRKSAAVREVNHLEEPL